MADPTRPSGPLPLLAVLLALAAGAARLLPAGEPVAPKLTASSSAPDHPPSAAMDGKKETSWESEAAGEQRLTVDFGAPRNAGGLAVTWEPELGATTFVVEASDDGKEWRVVRRVYGASGETSWVRLRPGGARFLRLRLLEGDGSAFGIREIALLPEETATSADALARAMASAARRGLFPRALRDGKEPPTLLAAGPDGPFLSPDGAVEPAGGGFRVEPFVRVAGALVTWADATTSASEPGEPSPSVRWAAKEVDLEVALLSESGAGATAVRYTLRNRTPGRLVATLALAVRPLRVRPAPGGGDGASFVEPIRSLSWDGRRVAVNGARYLVATPAPASFSAVTLAGGDVTSYLEAGRVPPERDVEDPTGFASGVLAFPLALDAHGAADVTVRIPPAGAKP